MDHSCSFDGFKRQFKPEELEITCDNFAELELEELTGKGWVRKVTKATWRGRKVAVKESIHDTAKTEYMMGEASLLFQLRKSENIVKLVGMCNSTTVFEYAPTTLQDLVFHGGEKISVGRTLSLGLDIVKGLAQLHGVNNGPIVHNDLKMDQYLIDSTGKVLLSDFHQSKYVGLDIYGKKCSYMACHGHEVLRPPECFSAVEKFGVKADIYSLALILWSLHSREHPYRILRKRDPEYVKQQIRTGERPDLALVSDYPQEMKDLIVEAWDSDPSKRPSAADLVKRMENIVQKYGQTAVDSV